MTPSPGALDGLADLVVPPPVPWTPQTWGWAVLAVVLLAVAAWAWGRHRRRLAANRYRVEALAELARIEARLGGEQAAALAAIPPLLKRVALAVWPRAEVAALSRADWVAFLRAHAPLPDAAARLLDDAEYRSPAELAALSAGDAVACARAARSWIEAHRV